MVKWLYKTKVDDRTIKRQIGWTKKPKKKDEKD